MSLFGDSADEAVSSRSGHGRSRSTIFGDEPSPPAESRGSLFSGDNDAGFSEPSVGSQGRSPWEMPTPRSQKGRRDVLRSLLPSDAVPEAYVDVYDSLLRGGYGLGGKVSVAGLEKILGASKIKAESSERIFKIVVPVGSDSGHGFGREEVNVLLALVGIAQTDEDEELSLDAVDERRKKLPVPKLFEFDIGEPKKAAKKENTAPVLDTSPTKTQKIARRDSLDDGIDPWSSPTTIRAREPTNGATLQQPTPQRQPSYTVEDDGPKKVTNVDPSVNEPSWNSFAESRPPYDANYGSAAASGVLSNPDFAGPPDHEQAPFNPADRGTGSSSRPALTGAEETISISVLNEKEGMFMFQHRHDQVFSPKRQSKVVRRYSDFVWLLDCLHKRYPFRQLPLLPPKRVAVNGRHLSADLGFVEKRRRGLVRFCNALVRHPVLAHEQLVLMFFTVPTELSAWRKQASVSVQDEFTGRSLPEDLEASLPENLQETFDSVRFSVRRASEILISQCNILERLSKRNEGMAAEYTRFSLGLQSLSDTLKDSYPLDADDVPQLNTGLLGMGKYLVTTQGLLIDEARAWDEGFLEDLKRQRDTFVSIRDMFDRREKLAKDNIPQLEARISGNEAKLGISRNKAPELVKPGEIEKLEEAIIKVCRLCLTLLLNTFSNGLCKMPTLTTCIG
jgi:sorting nexin-8